ncbi:MAG: tetratricopeptide repeat protein [Myxococcota bacterium]
MTLVWIASLVLSVHAEDPTPTATLEQQRAQCEEAEDSSACIDVGRRYLDGQPNDAGLILANAYFQIACDRDDAVGCSLLATNLYFGNGIEKDVVAAAKYYRNACYGEIPHYPACFDLSGIIQRGEVRATASLNRTALLKRACDGGVADGCTYLGRSYLDGDARTLERAAALLERACDGGSIEGCATLGAEHLPGGAFSTDADRAIPLLRKTCAQGNVRGCSNLATAYTNGFGVERDFDESRRLYALSCKQNDPTACRGLGILYAEGFGVDVDQERARTLFEHACRSGDPVSCDILRQAIRQ